MELLFCIKCLGIFLSKRTDVSYDLKCTETLGLSFVRVWVIVKDMVEFARFANGRKAG